jgi:hypothetical protein
MSKCVRHFLGSQFFVQALGWYAAAALLLAVALINLELRGPSTFWPVSLNITSAAAFFYANLKVRLWGAVALNAAMFVIALVTLWRMLGG